jgi:hypothetical protein
VKLYSKMWDYRIHRVPECLSLRGNWVPLTPSPASVSPPLDPKGGGEQHSLAGEGLGDPIRMTGQKAGHSVYSVNESKGFIRK